MVKILEMTSEHIEAVKDLLVELQEFIVEIDKYNLNILTPEYRETYFKYMMEDVSKYEGKVYVAIESDQVVGMIAGYVHEYDERDKLDYLCPRRGEVAELIVSKHTRSAGIGSKLLLVLEDYFKSIDCKYIQIDVFAYNEGGKRFYYKHGYEDRLVKVFKKIDGLDK